MKEFSLTFTDKTRPRNAKAWFRNALAVAGAVLIVLLVLLSIPVGIVLYGYYTAKDAIVSNLESAAHSDKIILEQARIAVEPHLRQAKFPEIGTDLAWHDYYSGRKAADTTHTVTGSCRSFDGSKSAKFHAEFTVHKFAAVIEWKLTYLEIDGAKLFTKN